MSAIADLNQKLKLALIVCASLMLNAFFLVILRLHEKSYDAYTHMFFSAHYAKSWWNPWNPKWYGGFDQTSYPPLCHQTIALFSFWFGVENAYILVQLLAVGILTLGIYRFSLIWVPEETARFATLLSIFLTSVAQCIYQFGQLPTIFSLGFLLNAAPFVLHWIREGRFRQLFMALLHVSLVMTSHHLTFLLGAMFFLGPVIFKSILDTSHADQNKRKVIVRAFFFIGLSGLLFVLLLYPFFYYLTHYAVTQREIPHVTRGNYFANLNSFLTFFLIPNSFLLPLIPFIAVGPSFKGRPLLVCFWAILFLLGLGGGATPVPKLLFGEMFYTLTFDRFCLWATVLTLPLLATAFFRPPLEALRLFIVLTAIAAYLIVLYGISAAKFQPNPINLTRLVDFLNQKDYRNYRYLTLGFGSQMSRLGFLTDAPTIDGNYHTARMITELRESGLESLDNAKYFPQGLQVMAEILKRAETFHLRFIFSNDPFYNDFLIQQGWRVSKTFKDGLKIWTTDGISPLMAAEMTEHAPVTFTFKHLLWGSYPVLYVLFALGLIGIPKPSNHKEISSCTKDFSSRLS